MLCLLSRRAPRCSAVLLHDRPLSTVRRAQPRPRRPERPRHDDHTTTAMATTTTRPQCTTTHHTATPTRLHPRPPTQPRPRPYSRPITLRRAPGTITTTTTRTTYHDDLTPTTTATTTTPPQGTSTATHVFRRSPLLSLLPAPLHVAACRSVVVLPEAAMPAPGRPVAGGGRPPDRPAGWFRRWPLAARCFPRCFLALLAGTALLFSFSEVLAS